MGFSFIFESSTPPYHTGAKGVDACSAAVAPTAPKGGCRCFVGTVYGLRIAP